MYTIKVELKLNNKEKSLMNRHIGCSHSVYNYGLNLYEQINYQKYKGGRSKKIDLIEKVFTNITKNRVLNFW